MNMYSVNKAIHSLLLLVILSLFHFINSTAPLETVKQWELISYNFQPHAPVHDTNFFNPLNVVITGIAVSSDRIFIVTPQLFSGVPSSLSFVSKSTFGDSPVLQAYPDWSYSSTGKKHFKCSDHIISSFRTRIDSCNRLWVLDSGISRTFEDNEKTCPAKILVIDLNTDKVVHRIYFPAAILRNNSLLTNLVIDETTAVGGTCDDVFVYVSDTLEPAIIVYNGASNHIWRLTHPSMNPDPDFAVTEILGHRFKLSDGIVGLTFDAYSRMVYFQPMATDRIFSIHSDALRGGNLSPNKHLPIQIVGIKSSQGMGIAVSPFNGSILFSPMSKTAIISLNPATEQQIVLAYDRERLQFVADITTAQSELGIIYVISSRFHRFFLKNVNANDTNIRILRLQLY